MSRKVLITGCNGFIGSHFVDFYTSKGYDVYGLDLKYRDGVSNRCNFIECNLNTDDVGNIYKKVMPDIFLHCAGNANVSVSVEHPEFDYESNVTVLYKTLSALNREKINPKFIFLSSAAVYGNPKKLPVSETDELNPISPYGLHKKMCEDLCKYYRNIKDMNISVVRIFSAYGEGLRKQILWDIYNKYKLNGSIELFGTGNETRDFIYIDDIIQAINLIVENSNSKFVYNVANGEEISIKKLAYEYGNIINLEKDKITFNGIVKKGDPLNWRADISRLETLGYKQSIKFENGIRKYIDWVKAID